VNCSHCLMRDSRTLNSSLITFYQLPPTMYQLPAFPLYKRLSKKRLNEKMRVKNSGLYAAAIGVLVHFQSPMKPAPGAGIRPCPGTNPISNRREDNLVKNLRIKSAVLFPHPLFSEAGVRAISGPGVFSFASRSPCVIVHLAGFESHGNGEIGPIYLPESRHWSATHAYIYAHIYIYAYSLTR